MGVGVVYQVRGTRHQEAHVLLSSIPLFLFTLLYMIYIISDIYIIHMPYLYDASVGLSQPRRRQPSAHSPPPH